MFQFNILRTKKKNEEVTITKEMLQEFIENYLNEHPHASMRSIITSNNTIDYSLLKKYFKKKPINQFIMAKETGEIFEDTEGNRQLVKWINETQRAMDQYVYEQQTFPLKENNEKLEICYMKLSPYLKALPSVPMYLSKKYFTVSHSPDKK